MVGLVKVIQDDFPIAGQPHGIRHGASPEMNIASLPFIPDRSQVLLQTDAIRVHINPDKTGESFTAQFL